MCTPEGLGPFELASLMLDPRSIALPNQKHPRPLLLLQTLRTGAQAACPAVTHTPPTFGFHGFQQVRPRYGMSSIGTSSSKPSRASDKLWSSIGGISVVGRWVTLGFWSRNPLTRVPCYSKTAANAQTSCHDGLKISDFIHRAILYSVSGGPGRTVVGSVERSFSRCIMGI